MQAIKLLSKRLHCLSSVASPARIHLGSLGKVVIGHSDARSWVCCAGNCKKPYGLRFQVMEYVHINICSGHDLVFNKKADQQCPQMRHSSSSTSEYSACLAVAVEKLLAAAERTRLTSSNTGTTLNTPFLHSSNCQLNSPRGQRPQLSSRLRNGPCSASAS